MDPYGSALKAFSEEKETDALKLHNSYGEVEEMPLWYFFRNHEEMPDLEKMALTVCEGKVLDVGAGTGCHAICLQQMGYEVTAIDTSQVAVDIMKTSHIKDARAIDYFKFDDSAKFDTILCLMNGVGFVGKLNRFKDFLAHAEKLLKPGGQIILDSSDVAYLYADGEKPVDRYYGEVQFQYEYEGKKGEWFDWVYIDSDSLDAIAFEAGWFVYFLHTDDNDQYLVRLIRK